MATRLLRAPYNTRLYVPGRKPVLWKASVTRPSESACVRRLNGCTPADVFSYVMIPSPGMNRSV